MFGGSFDPPHVAHQKIVKTLSALPYIDKVIVVPAHLNPFKSSSLASPMQRLKWCKELFAEPNVTVDDSEVKAQKSVYTIDTFRKLKQDYDVRYIAIGSDNLGSIEKWHGFDELNENVVWLVFGRAGFDQGYDKLREYMRFDIDEPVSSSYIRQSGNIEKVDEKISNEVQKILKKDNNG